MPNFQAFLCDPCELCGEKVQVNIVELRKIIFMWIGRIGFPGWRMWARPCSFCARAGLARACCFKVFSNRDYMQANELTVKTAFLTLLFSDTFYVMDSEPALERTYADMTMILRPEMRKYKLLDILFEFKFIGLKAAGLTGEAVRGLSRDELKARPDVQQKLVEARAQLLTYIPRLNQKYGAALRLRTFAVVAIGFERLVWDEVV
jgi:hypothetical protein